MQTTNSAHAACAQQTLTVSLTTAGGTLSGTKCITNADITILQSAFSSTLVAGGIPSPTAAQEWTAGIALMATALNSFVLNYATGQAQLQAPAVTFVGAQ
jgi:hypothetical protein